MRSIKNYAMALLMAALLLSGLGGLTVAPDATAEWNDLLAAATNDIQTISFQEAWARVRGDAEAVYLFATNVGKGDALILRVDDYLCLIDTGKTWARGRVDRALALMGSDLSSPDSYHIDALFLTHTDDDHVGGLRWMTAKDSGDLLRTVDNMYASAMYTGVKEKKHPAVDAVEKLMPREFSASPGEVQWLKRGDAVPLGDTGAVLRVLAPASLYTDKDDNNSLVMMLESDQGRILLTGDMELPEEAELLAFGDDLTCDVLKAPNHADDDTTSAAFAQACAARLAVISTDSWQKPGTPDPNVVRRLEAAGSTVAVTQDSGLGILVTLKNGLATAEYVSIDAPVAEGLYIREVNASDDRVVLGSRADAAIDLGGFYLYSDRGDELFPFPEGTWIEPNATLTVGTKSTKGAYDLLWPDKKVINKKKTDTICLYDNWGRLIDAMDNGK